MSQRVVPHETLTEQRSICEIEMFIDFKLDLK
jgi:hypothetical protein